MYKDVMLDLETLGTRENAVVVSMGAVLFNLEDQDAFDDLDNNRCFYAVLDLRDQSAKGRTINTDTVAWWMQQGPLAREVFTVPGVDVRQVLAKFADFCRGREAIWGNGNMFDNAITRSLYATYGVPYPVNFRNDLDLRTLKRLSGTTSYVVPSGIAHNALDDAKVQVLQAQAFYRSLRTAA